MPRERFEVMRALAEREPEVSTQEIADVVSLPTTTARRVSGDLSALKLVERIGGKGGRDGSHRWVLSDEGARLWTVAGLEP